MGIQDSVNTIIGSVTSVGVANALHKFKTSQEASTEAQWRMEDQLNSIKNIQRAMQMKKETFIPKEKDTKIKGEIKPKEPKVKEQFVKNNSFIDFDSEKGGER